MIKIFVLLIYHKQNLFITKEMIIIGIIIRKHVPICLINPIQKIKIQITKNITEEN